MATTSTSTIKIPKGNKKINISISKEDAKGLEKGREEREYQKRIQDRILYKVPVMKSSKVSQKSLLLCLMHQRAATDPSSFIIPTLISCDEAVNE